MEDSSILAELEKYSIKDFSNTFAIILPLRIKKINENELYLLDKEKIKFEKVDKEGIISYDFTSEITKTDSYFTGLTWFSKDLLKQIKKVIKGMNFQMDLVNENIEIYENKEENGLFPLIIEYQEWFFLLAPKQKIN